MIEIDLTAQERALVAEYGYPFPEVECQLRAASASSERATISIEPLFLEVLLGDLCISLKQLDDPEQRDALDELIDVLERHARGPRA